MLPHRTQLQPSSAEIKILSHPWLFQVRDFCPAQLPVSASAWHLITASCVRELLGLSMAQCSHCTWDFLLQWCLWRREQYAPRHGLSQRLWPQIYQLQPSSAAKTQTLLKGIWIVTDSVAVSQRTRHQRNGFTQLQREANLHSRNRQQIHHPSSVQTHLFHPRQSPILNPATSRCNFSQNRGLNCQINQQRELWQYNKTTLNWQCKNKIKCCRY